MNDIRKNFAYNSFLMVSNYIINFILFPYCTRVLGVERFGTINFTENIVQYFLFLGMMGVSHVGVREIAKQKDKEGYNRCFSSILGLNILFTTISLAIFIPLIFYVERFENTKILFLLGSLNILFTAFSVDWYFRGTENFKYITTRNLVIKICYVICVFIFVKEPNDYILLYALTVSTTVVCALINYIYASKYINFSLKRIDLKIYLKSTLSLGAYSILTSMYTTFNVAYLGFVWDDIQVGYYSTALKLYTVILGFYSAFTGVMLPRMTNINSDGNESFFNSMIQKSFELLFTIAIPMVVVLFILAPEIITLLAGEEFVPSIWLSRIIVPMLFVVGIAQIIAFQILIPKGFDKQTLYASIIGASIGIISNLILTTNYGALGTCITVAITETTVTIYYIAVIAKNKIIDFNIRILWKHILVSFPYIFICLTVQYFSLGNIITLSISFLLCIIYFMLSQSIILKNSLVLNILLKFPLRKK